MPANIRRSRRSTGTRDGFPQPADCGSQGDRPYEIEPDKGGIAGYALVLLFEATGERRYLEQGLQNARVLAAHQSDGDAFAFAVALSRRLSQRRRARAGFGQYGLYPAALRPAALAWDTRSSPLRVGRCGIGSSAIRLPSAVGRRSTVCAVLRGSRDAHQSHGLGAAESRALFAREKGTARSRLARRLRYADRIRPPEFHSHANSG